jgi:uncharacterized protein YndB with AHSA1/START domain
LANRQIIGIVMKVTIEIVIEAPIKTIWEAWVTPEDITQWNFAIEEWCCPSAKIDFVEGGNFNYRMEAKDGSFGFDFKGEFTHITLHKLIQYSLEDGRMVMIEFIDSNNGVKVVQTFDTEDENSAEQQRQGWLGILTNFKTHVEEHSVNVR